MTRKRELPVYVSLDEAAEIMSLSTRTIRRRISDGTIPRLPMWAPLHPATTRRTRSRTAPHPLSPAVTAMDDGKPGLPRGRPAAPAELLALAAESG